MRGKLSKRCLLLSVLLLLPSALYSQSSDGPEFDPLGIYEVPGWKLIELQTERALRETQLTELSRERTTSKRALTAVRNELETLRRAIDELETSSMASLDRVRSAERRATMYRSLSIVLGTTTAGGVLFVLFTIFGSPAL